jgi:hypothetical protein
VLPPLASPSLVDVEPRSSSLLAASDALCSCARKNISPSAGQSKEQGDGNGTDLLALLALLFVHHNEQNAQQSHRATKECRTRRQA